MVAGGTSVVKGVSSGGKAGVRCRGRQVRATQLRIKGLWQPRPGSTVRTSSIQLSGPGGALTPSLSQGQPRGWYSQTCVCTVRGKLSPSV